jgi:hypothetical protein
MEVESNFSISKKDELKIKQILQKEDKSNILNYSKYFGNQNIKDIQNKNITSKTYQNNIINISLNKDNNNKQNLNINLNNKENPNYLNNYNMINNYYNNINNYTKNINRKINNINNNKIMNIQNQLEGNSGESFNIEIQNKSNINKINFKSNNTKKEYIINNKQKKLIIQNINVVLNLLSNYKGSIFLQNILLNMNSNEISLLFQTISPYICRIMCLDFGNYFIQKLIKNLNVQQRLDIYQIIENNFLDIATNKSGTHSIQALIDSIQNPIEHLYFEKLLNKDMLLLFKNENGYHIIMKIILEVNENQRNNLNLFFIYNVEKIITNPYGAYCGTKFILYNSNLNLRVLLINNIKNNIKNLLFNKHSCLFIMLAIKKFGIDNFQFIIDEIKNNLSFLSLHPISNLFVTRLFKYLKSIEYNNFTSIIWNIYRNDNLIKGLCSSRNGTILLKKIIEYSSSSQKRYIKNKIKYYKKV